MVKLLFLVSLTKLKGSGRSWGAWCEIQMYWKNASIFVCKEEKGANSISLLAFPSLPFSHMSKKQNMCKRLKLIYANSMRTSTAVYRVSNSVGLSHPYRCFPCSEIVTL